MFTFIKSWFIVGIMLAAILVGDLITLHDGNEKIQNLPKALVISVITAVIIGGPLFTPMVVYATKQAVLKIESDELNKK